MFDLMHDDGFAVDLKQHAPIADAYHSRANSASYLACVPMKSHTIDSPWR
jgi:hypothetical protein